MLRTEFPPGAPNWIDLSTPDTEAAVAFYRELFGWTYSSAGPRGGGYGFFLLGGRTVAGCGPCLGEDADPSWTVHFHSADADVTARAVEEAGGTVRAAPMAILDAGRLAAFADPEGAEFSVWEPGEVVGPERTMEPGSLCWTELYSTGRERVVPFYRSVFAWEFTEAPMGSGAAYTIVAPSGMPTAEAAHGGLLQLPPESLAAGVLSEWHPYFAVEDCDGVCARALRHGATARIAPVSVPGVGRLAMLRDPAGATFSVLKGDPQQG